MRLGDCLAFLVFLTLIIMLRKHLTFIVIMCLFILYATTDWYYEFNHHVKQDGYLHAHACG